MSKHTGETHCCLEGSALGTWSGSWWSPTSKAFAASEMQILLRNSF